LRTLVSVQLQVHLVQHYGPADTQFVEQRLDPDDLYSKILRCDHRLARHPVQLVVLLVQLGDERLHFPLALLVEPIDTADLLVGEAKLFLDRFVLPPEPVRWTLPPRLIGCGVCPATVRRSGRPALHAGSGGLRGCDLSRWFRGPLLSSSL